MEKIVCKKCILHSKVPEVSIGKDGLCVFCEISNHVTPNLMKQNATYLESRMLSIFEEVKKQNRMFDVFVITSYSIHYTKLYEYTIEGS